AARPGRPGWHGPVGRAPGAGPVAGLRPAARPRPRPGLRRVVLRRLPRPRFHATRRAAVRRRWPGRDGGSSLRLRGPVTGRARPAAALRAWIRRTAPVRGSAARTRRHTPGRAVLLPVRTAGPRAPARVAVPRGLPGPPRPWPAAHPARYGRACPSPGRAARSAPPGRPELRPDASAQNRFDGSARHGSDAPTGYGSDARPDATGRNRPDAAARHRPDAPPRPHAPSRPAVAGWRPGCRLAHRPAAGREARVTPGQA